VRLGSWVEAMWDGKELYLRCGSYLLHLHFIGWEWIPGLTFHSSSSQDRDRGCRRSGMGLVCEILLIVLPVFSFTRLVDCDVASSPNPLIVISLLADTVALNSLNVNKQNINKMARWNLP
jgi:hypothetical protein